MINDAHCHFFSPAFFSALARQRMAAGVAAANGEADLSASASLRRDRAEAPVGREGGQVRLLCDELQWDDPGTPDALADRWARELDAHGVARAALIASVPGDEESVGAAIRRHPDRFVGFFMLDPAAPDAPARARRALTDLGLKAMCLFPAMHHVPLHDDRTVRAVEAAAGSGGAVFVHCGFLSVGVRRKLGLPSAFDLHLGDPLALSRLAQAFPRVPFIVPHFGAGLFREALMAAEACPNVYFDTSSSNRWIRYLPGLTLDAVFQTALGVLGPTRLLSGTDSSFFPRGWQRGVFDLQASILERIGVGKDDQALILGGNFERLFPV